MPCEHVGPHEIIAMADAHLRDRNIEPSSGLRIRYAENTPETMWASVVTEIERRGEQWIVTKIDRREQPLDQSETGLRMV